MILILLLQHLESNTIMEDKKRTYLILSFLAIGILLRILPHPFNFTPIAALALFAGVQFKNNKLAYLVPLVMMLLSDIILQGLYYVGITEWPAFYDSMPMVYASFLLVVLIGRAISSSKNALKIGAGAVAGSLVFFLLSNFGVWLFGDGIMYTRDLNGILDCFAAGVPFYRNTLLGDLIYTGVFFGIFEFVQSRAFASKAA